ncbi:MAG: hypothetical protein KF691_06105 [Phycisphaeraceae bacterium]|nr:hypothetical protein [Phycisphaeraceae bacterium]
MSTLFRRVVIAAIVGSSAGLSAFADEVSRASLSNVPIKSIGQTPHGGSDTFGDRAYSVLVYDNLTSLFSHSFFNATLCSHLLEDVNFTPGPYGSSFVGDRALTAMGFAFNVSGASTAPFDFRFSFYRPSQVTFAGFGGAGTSMIDPGAVPYHTITITEFETVCGGITQSTWLVFPSAVSVPAGDSSLWLDAAIVEPGTPGSSPLTSTNLFQLNKTTAAVSFVLGSASNAMGPAFTGSQTAAALSAASNPANIGYTSAMYGRDGNFDAIFTGSLTVSNTGSSELRYSVSNSGSSGRTNALSLAFTGIASPPPAVPATSINGPNGFLPDGVSSVSGSLTSSEKYKWYKFNTKNQISYAEATFLDVDTEGSQTPTAFALYSADSTLFELSMGRGDGPDSNRPSELDNQQMSFGVARRPGVGSGVQYAGQEGNLPAGEFYLAVALGGSGFGDGWNVLPVDPITPKSYSLNFNNNNQKTISAPPAVAPTISDGADLAILRGEPQSTTELSVGPREVEFVRFSLTNPLPSTGQFNQSDNSPLSDVTFLDVTQPGSSVAGEWNFALYNNGGSLANSTSISYAGAGYNGNNGGGDGPSGCGGTFAQLSYGIAPSRGYPPPHWLQSTLGLPLNNQNGSSLPADQYYLAVSLGDAHFANERWGARSSRTSSLTAVLTIGSDNRGPSIACPADFNGDGGVDDTDFTFFAKYYNDLTNPAGDIDGSNDGLTDDSDFAVFVGAYDTLVCF